MRPIRDHGPRHPVHNLLNHDLRKAERAADLIRRSLDLDLVALDSRRQVRDVDIDGHARLPAQIPRRDRHAARPVHDGRADGPVYAARGVHVVLRK